MGTRIPAKNKGALAFLAILAAFFGFMWWVGGFRIAAFVMVIGVGGLYLATALVKSDEARRDRLLLFEHEKRALRTRAVYLWIAGDESRRLHATQLATREPYGTLLAKWVCDQGYEGDDLDGMDLDTASGVDWAALVSALTNGRTPALHLHRGPPTERITGGR